MADSIKKTNWSEQAPDAHEASEKPTNSRYKGKNFDPNYKSGKGEGKPKSKKPVSKPPSKDNDKQDAPNTANSKAKEDSLFKSAIFGEDITIRENQLRTRFTPSCVGLLPLVERVWNEMVISDPRLSRQLTVEGFKYYIVGMLWLRILELKLSQSFTLTQIEQDVTTMTQNTTFSIPEPIAVYLRGLGQVKIDGLGKHLLPDFPPLPNGVVQNIQGLYGPISTANHNLYEEVPAIGVLVEAITRLVDGAQQGPYVSVLSTLAVAPNPARKINANVLGYGPISVHRPESIAIYTTANITPQVFGNTIANTGINIDLFHTVSQIINKSSTFKVAEGTIRALPQTGSQAQVIKVDPIQEPALTAFPTRNVFSNSVAHSLVQFQTAQFGAAYYTLYNMYKESAAPGDPNVVVRTWAGIDFEENDPWIVTWSANRNVRRDLPPEFESDRFIVVSQNLNEFRIRTVAKQVAKPTH